MYQSRQNRNNILDPITLLEDKGLIFEQLTSAEQVRIIAEIGRHKELAIGTTEFDIPKGNSDGV